MSPLAQKRLDEALSLAIGLVMGLVRIGRILSIRSAFRNSRAM